MTHFVIFITLTVSVSCRQSPEKLVGITGNQIPITDSLHGMDSILTYVASYGKHIDEVLDEQLAYAPVKITKEDGSYNSSEGNLMADIVMERANPVFESRTGKKIDFVLINFGGLRSSISKGPVSARTAYEVMPFENHIMVVELSGKSVGKLIDFLVASHTAHPISGLHIVLDKNDRLRSVDIQGKPFDKNRHYFVATSNYLLGGGDHMDFFKEAIQVTDIDYLIRKAMIDYFTKNDTITAAVDDRFIKVK
ncbi:5'-nucleotidase C-terminal domain-containing protein [Flavobacteriaceae bacterium F89]|uniref:5'-nucleotidase C-terminal domain-containing protein n=1 Tax=Cerina litoralis TaxID=2874477 RepID=A0AAE3ES55_9FLAO|nr:5'-nucleotidase [Cerina litoralis]MCG2459968.1 5'-nucleotidase C-terminal domain-containing protein [Cerina litoralis]